MNIVKHKNLEQVDSFRDFLNGAEPIRFREPFAETLKESNLMSEIKTADPKQRRMEKVKKECDKIGYCCFTPKDLK
jgi:hypothetical protein